MRFPLRTFLLALCLWLSAAGIGQRDAEAAYTPGGVACSGQIIVNQTASTDLRTFTNTGYICYMLLVSATSQNINLVNGTGTVCATGIAGVLGGTTAGTGPNLAANAGWSSGSGLGVVAQMTTSGQHLCLLQSGSGQLSGIIRYADQ